MRRSGTVIATAVCVVAILLVLILPGRLMGDDDGGDGGVGAVGTATVSAGAAVAAGAVSTALVAAATPTTPPIARATTPNCDVTQPAEFRPVEWNPVWYQLGSIWISPILPGAGGSNPSAPDEGSLWFTGLQQMGLVFDDDVTSELQITPIDTATGLPTDGTLDIPVSHAQDTPDGLIAGGGVELDTPGCWQITSPDAPGAALVIDVRPFEERADVAAAISARTAATTVEPPAACGADEWDVADPFGYAYAVYILKRDDVLLELDRPGVFTANQPMHLAVRLTEDGPTTLRLIPLANPDAAMEADTMSQVRASGATRAATLTFPHDGCWGLEVAANGETTSFTLFVQPE